MLVHVPTFQMNQDSKMITCGSVNLRPGVAERPARSCSMYPNTRYRLRETEDVIIPSKFMIFG